MTKRIIVSVVVMVMVMVMQLAALASKTLRVASSIEDLTIVLVMGRVRMVPIALLSTISFNRAILLMAMSVVCLEMVDDRVQSGEDQQGEQRTR